MGCVGVIQVIAMKQDTKQKIIESGARIIHHKGYHHTGIQEVLSAAGVPKGSFYFYFQNKEDFGLQVIDFFNTMYLGMLEPVVKDKSLSPLQRLEKIFDLFIGLFQDMDYQCGCPIGSDEFQKMGEALEKHHNQPKFNYTATYQKKSGEVFPGESRVFYIRNTEDEITGVVGLIRDVSERIKDQEEKARLEANLRQAQKMEALGTLAGGIAHDFNNILSGIMGYTEIGLFGVDKESELHDYLKRVLEAGKRASSLVSQILNFRGRGHVLPPALPTRAGNREGPGGNRKGQGKTI